MNRAQLAALLLTAAIIAVATVAANYVTIGGTSLGSVITESSVQPLTDIRELRVSIRMGVGTLQVTTADSPNAYEAKLTHDKGTRVTIERSEGALRIVDRRSGFQLGGLRRLNEWTIQLTRRVPVQLRVSTGAGRQRVDLTGMSGSAEISTGAGEVRLEFQPGTGTLERLTLRGGAGRLQTIGLGNAHVKTIEARAGVGDFVLDFSGTGSGTTDVNVRGGVGRVTLTIPRDVGVRIRVRRGLGQLTLPGFSRTSSGEYVNETWSGATARLDIQASVGVGTLEVRPR